MSSEAPGAPDAAIDAAIDAARGMLSDQGKSGRQAMGYVLAAAAPFIVTEGLEQVGEVCRCEEDRKLLHDIAAELRQETNR